MNADSLTGLRPKPRKKQRKRILLVDDHPLVREGLSALIRATPDLAVAGEAGSVEEACKLLDAQRPDLVLIDLILRGKDGIDLIKQVRGQHPALRMLVLSMHEEAVYAERVLRAGAHGYIMKEMPSSQILKAIRSVLSGEIYVSPAITTRMLKQVLDKDARSRPSDSLENLSNRELQVFLSIGNGLSSKEIAERLNLDIKTIQTYREHIKRKFGLRNATCLIHYATQWANNNRA